MAWMLWEIVVRNAAEHVISLFLKGLNVIMSETCVLPACKRLKAIGKRGLCNECYRQAKKKVDAQQTTWDRLERLGLCEGERTPFDDAYDEATRDT